MEVYKCDRCGKYYDSTSHERDLYVIANPYNSYTKKDLCQKCLDELMSWWRQSDKEEDDDK